MDDEIATKVAEVNKQNSSAWLQPRLYVPAMTVGERIDALLREKGWSQAQLGKRVGVSTQAIWKLVSGNGQGSKHLHKIARELGTTPEYLTGETDNPAADRTAGAGASYRQEPNALSRDEWAHEMGLIEIEEIDLGIGMGATYLDEATVNSVARWMPEDWVRRFTNAPATHLTIASPRGDSMYPTINDRDIIIIDKSRRSIDEQEAIWALSYGGLGTIKRVRAMPDGSYKLMADNPQVREETAVDGEMFVFGRVVGVIRRT